MKDEKNIDSKSEGQMRLEIRKELEKLDNELVNADGIMLKPSQCYRIEANHILYNTSCPESLKRRIQSILLRYS
jgi:hypothetical protein